MSTYFCRNHNQMSTFNDKLIKKIGSIWQKDYTSMNYKQPQDLRVKERCNMGMQRILSNPKNVPAAITTTIAVTASLVVIFANHAGGTGLKWNHKERNYITIPTLFLCLFKCVLI